MRTTGRGAATISNSGDSTATAKGAGANAAVLQDSNNSTAAATGTNTTAEVDESNGSDATSRDGGSASVYAGISSSARATGADSNAQINADESGYNPVANSQATATNGGTADVQNDGNAPASIIAVTNDTAVARGSESNATVLDSQNSSLALTNGTSFTLSGQSDVHLISPPPQLEMTPLAETHLAPSLPEPDVMPGTPLP